MVASEGSTILGSVGDGISVLRNDSAVATKAAAAGRLVKAVVKVKVKAIMSEFVHLIPEDPVRVGIFDS
jgi:hypothetical protein